MEPTIYLSIKYKGNTMVASLEQEQNGKFILRNAAKPCKIYDNITQFHDDFIIYSSSKLNTNQINNIDIFYGGRYLEKYKYFHIDEQDNKFELSTLNKKVLNYLKSNNDEHSSINDEMEVKDIIMLLSTLSLNKKKQILLELLQAMNTN